MDDVIMGYGGLTKATIGAIGKMDFKEKLIESMMQTASDFSGRSISPYSLLPEQARRRLENTICHMMS